MVEGGGSAHPDVTKGVHHGRVDHLVDGHHGRVLEVVHPVDQTEADFEEQTARRSQLHTTRSLLLRCHRLGADLYVRLQGSLWSQTFTTLLFVDSWLEKLYVLFIIYYLLLSPCCRRSSL